jgi:tetratricopeptide (TPR) repeat protein
MVADKKKIAADCWKKGSEALAKENWDYSIKMFTMAAELIPDNLLYRQTLRGAEKKKYKNNKTGARMAKVKVLGIRARIKKSRAQKDWAAVAKTAEDGLQLNPWDGSCNADLGNACMQLGFPEVAAFSYELAVEAEPNNKDYLRSLAALYEERGDYSAAVNLWERLRKLDPNDGEARSKR